VLFVGSSFIVRPIDGQSSSYVVTIKNECETAADVFCIYNGGVNDGTAKNLKSTQSYSFTFTPSEDIPAALCTFQCDAVRARENYEVWGDNVGKNAINYFKLTPKTINFNRRTDEKW
jgi:hypothetical protein